MRCCNCRSLKIPWFVNWTCPAQRIRAIFWSLCSSYFQGCRHELTDSSAHYFQAGKRSGAGAELFGFDAHALEHGDEEVRERRRVVLIERQVLAVTEAASGQEDGHVLDAVGGSVAQVAREEDHRAIQQARAVLFGLLQLLEKLAQGFHLFDFERLKLRDLAGILAVVRQVVMAEIHALDWRHAAGAQ